MDKLSDKILHGRRASTPVISPLQGIYNPSRTVKAVPRMKNDVHALRILMRSKIVVKKLVQGTTIMVARYCFGDASGSGFGSSWVEGSKGIRYKVGFWGIDKGDQSLNFKELANLVTTLEDMSNNNDGICGVEICLFVDNSVAEGAVFKESSTSEKVFDLVLRLKMLEVECGIRLHFCHVAGNRMIKQGKYGLSRASIGMGHVGG